MASESVLRNDGYRRLYISAALVIFGVMGQAVARGWLARELTGTNAGLGGVMLVFGVAMLLATPWGGVAADRLSKRLVLLGSVGALTLSSLLLGRGGDHRRGGVLDAARRRGRSGRRLRHVPAGPHCLHHRAGRRRAGPRGGDAQRHGAGRRAGVRPGAGRRDDGRRVVRHGRRLPRCGGDQLVVGRRPVRTARREIPVGSPIARRWPSWPTGWRTSGARRGSGLDRRHDDPRRRRHVPVHDVPPGAGRRAVRRRRRGLRVDVGRVGARRRHGRV